MAVISPDTDVILLKVPLEISEDHQLTFANATAQYNYFNALPKVIFEQFTYQRKDNIIKVPALIDNLYGYNYVMYRNNNHSNKWFYAFITDMTYSSDQVTAISIKTDVWQTWQFDLNFKRVFVEREHTNDDTIGNNLVPENLETGDFVLNGSETKMGYYTRYYVINSTYEPYNGSAYQGVNNYGIPIAGGLFLFTAWQQMINAIQSYANDGRLESIAQVYIAPITCFNSNDLELKFGPDETDEEAYYLFKGSASPRTVTTTVVRPATLNGYTPRNKKLLTGQFANLVISNNNGSVNNLYYEYFTNPSACVIEGTGIPTVGGSIEVYPKNYKGLTNNFNEEILGGKYPTLSWSGDAYTNWLTQNAVNIGAGVVQDVAKLPFIPFNPVAAGASLLSSVMGQVSEVRKHSMVAQTINGNVNGGDVHTAGLNNDVFIYPMSITYQFAERIDQFFDMFGYKTNKVKLPNITGRTNWNYVKTIGCYIEADIPQGDLAEIKSMFDKGITFWHNPTTFMDYSQSNAIVTP